MPDIVIVYSTFSKKAEAQKVVNTLLGKKLIACGVITGPTTSSYRWKGKIVTEKEYVLLAKTTSKRLAQAKHILGAIHPYTTPCILWWKVESNAAYARWVSAEAR